MNGEQVIHVGVLCTTRPRMALIVPASIVVACDGCGRDLWVDPACCREVGGDHEHACYDCAGPVTADDVRIPVAALRALETYRRRN